MPSNYGIRICKLDECNELVRPSKNKGVEALYCSSRHSNTYHQRQTRLRRAGATGEGNVDVQRGKPFVRRTMPNTIEAAEGRFQKHKTNCFASEDGICPSQFDPLDRKRACLIHAVFREDVLQLRRATEKAIKWEREVTSETGFWLEDAVELQSDLVQDKIDARRAAFLAAGGARTDMGSPNAD